MTVGDAMLEWEVAEIDAIANDAFLRVRCPGCGAEYKTLVSLTAGKSDVRHPVCGTVVTIEHPALANFASRGWVTA